MRGKKSDHGVLLVLDCGSTNLRVVAFDSAGEQLAQRSRINGAIPQPGGEPGWMIWDFDDIWNKLCQMTREVADLVGAENILAVISTVWGSDGAPVDKKGNLTYPPISWSCIRTQKNADEFIKKTSSWEVFKKTGAKANTTYSLMKWMWLRENVPEALDKAHCWQMTDGLIANRLTDEFYIEPTSASTTLALDVGHRDWDSSLLEMAGLDPSFFPEMRLPGQVVGYVTEKASQKSGLPKGIPVLAGGHDTQFAMIGACPRPEEIVLSSGTWEIIGIRAKEFDPNKSAFESGLLIEADPVPGQWNAQLLMAGSAVLEWIRHRFFIEPEASSYDRLIQEARGVSAGSDGVMLIPSFFRDVAPNRRFSTKGTILGLTLKSSRGQIFRAGLEGLSYQLRTGLELFSQSTGFASKAVHVVGGGSKNDLWNQIRSDVTGMPVRITQPSEATSLGAAIVACAGLGIHSSIEAGQKKIGFRENIFTPSNDRPTYNSLYKKYSKLPPALEDFYGGCL